MIGIERQLDPPVQRLCDGAWRIFELIEYRAPAVANLGDPLWHKLSPTWASAFPGSGAGSQRPSGPPATILSGFLQVTSPATWCSASSESASCTRFPEQARVRHGDDQRGGAYLQEGRSLRA